MVRTGPYFKDPSEWNPVEVLEWRYDELLDSVLEKKYVLRERGTYSSLFSHLPLQNVSAALRTLEIKDRGPKNKARLLTILESFISENLVSILTSLPNQAYQVVLALVEGDGITQIMDPIWLEGALFLSRRGLCVVLEEDINICTVATSKDMIPRIKECLVEVSDRREELGRDSLVIKLARLVDAYGLVSFTSAIDLFIAQGILQDTPKDMRRIMQAFDEFDVYVEDPLDEDTYYLCDIFINDPQEILRMRRDIQKPMPILPERLQSDMLDDSIPFPDDADVLEEMFEFFEPPVFWDEEIVTLRVQTVSNSIKQGFTEDFVIFHAISVLGPQPFEYYQEMAKYIRQWMNRLHLWSRHGYTRNAVPRTVKKPGRDGLCPCGSGKKYKHCCGSPFKVIK